MDFSRPRPRAVSARSCPHVPELDEWAAREDAELYELARLATAPEKTSWDVLDEAFLEAVRSH